MSLIDTFRPRQLLVIHLIQGRLKTIRKLSRLWRLNRRLVPAHLVHVYLLLLALVPQILQCYKWLKVVFLLVVLYVLPVLFLYELVWLSVLQLGLWLPQNVRVRLFLVEFLFCVQEWQLCLSPLAVLVLKFFQDWVDVVFVRVRHWTVVVDEFFLVYHLERIWILCVMFARLLELLLCRSENVNFLVFFYSVEFRALWLFLEHNFLTHVLWHIDRHSLKKLVL